MSAAPDFPKTSISSRHTVTNAKSTENPFILLWNIQGQLHKPDSIFVNLYFSYQRKREVFNRFLLLVFLILRRKI